MNNEQAYFCFLDLETTGLDPVNDKALEVAAIVTDRNLNELAHFRSVIWMAGQAQLSMPPNVVKMHKESGLLDDLTLAIENSERIGLIDVQSGLVDFIRKFPPTILAGFSVHFDKEFLRIHMPVVLGLFTHKIMDVSAVKIPARLWRTDLPEYQASGTKHRAYDDCVEAINSLKHYKQHLFDLPSEAGSNRVLESLATLTE